MALELSRKNPQNLIVRRMLIYEILSFQIEKLTFFIQIVVNVYPGEKNHDDFKLTLRLELVSNNFQIPNWSFFHYTFRFVCMDFPKSPGFFAIPRSLSKVKSDSLNYFLNSSIFETVVVHQKNYCTFSSSKIFFLTSFSQWFDHYIKYTPCNGRNKSYRCHEEKLWPSV